MIDQLIDLGIDLRGSTSGEIKTICPNCSHTRKKSTQACLNVNIDEGVYNCWHCEEFSGGVKKKSNSKPVQAVKKNFKTTQLDDLSGKVIEWFQGRGISERTLKLANVKSAKKWMPQTQKEESTIAFQFIKDNLRVNTKYRDGRKNMSQDKGGEKCFYRYDSLKEAEKIYITEGEIDALTLLECGYNNGVTSVPDGAPNPTKNSLETKFSYLNEESQKIFDECKEVVLLTDNDENGRFLESELARRIGKDKCLRVEYPEGCKDLNDVLVQHGLEATKELIENAEHYPISGVHKFADFKQDILDYYDGNSKEKTSTGWSNMDEHYQLIKGHLNILTGIPNSGKSEWLDAMMVNTIKNNNWSWAIYSPENLPAEFHFQKLVEKISGKSMMFEGDRISRDNVETEIEAFSEVIDLIIPPEDEMSLDDILCRIKSSVFRTGIDAFIIDPWNEIDHRLKDGQSETDYISYALAKVRRFARQHELSAWIVAHPAKLYKNRDTGEYPVPTLYDISGSANWRNKADNGFVVWRDFQGDQTTKVYVQKIRFKDTGKLGEVSFKWDWKTGRYNPVLFGDKTTDEQLSEYNKEVM
jgi:twinkle protein